MAEMVSLRTLSCTARGLSRQYGRPIERADLDNVVMEAGFAQYVPIAKSGAKCGQSLTSGDFPYDGNVEVVAYNAAKNE